MFLKKEISMRVGLVALCGVLGVNSASANLLEEIVVTVSKREQSVQDVTASVVAIDGEHLRQLGLEDAASLAAVVPNFTFSAPAGEGTNPSLSMRGIGTNDVFDSNESSVAVYADEVYYGSLAGITSKVFDVERVEVLRGPQGTLYGRNSTAGLVHFVSKRPTDEFTANVKLEAGTYNSTKIEGGIGGPLTDSLNGRLALYYDKADGFTQDRETGDRGGDRDTLAFRGLLDFNINEQTDLLLIANTSRLDNTASYYERRGLQTEGGGFPGTEGDPSPCSASAISADQCVDVFGYGETDGDLYKSFSGRAQPLKIDSDGVSAQLNWSEDEWSFTSITAFHTVDKFHTEATLSTPLSVVDEATNGEGIVFSGVNRLTVTFAVETDQVTQEFRLTNTTDDMVWMVGAFYFDEDKKGFLQDSPGYTNNFDQQTEAYGIFGHVEKTLVGDWSVKAGIRYSDEERELANIIELGGIFGPGLLFPGGPHEQNYSTDNVSWNFGLNWQPEDLLVFANVSKGVKSGGFNSAGLVTESAQLVPFDDETVTSYEIGFKSTLFDGSAQLNGTVFYNDFEDFQAFSATQVLGQPVNKLTNAGDAITKGLELELIASPFEHVELMLGVGYLSAKLDSLSDPESAASFGEELVLSPELSYSGLVRFFYPAFGGEFSAQIDVAHKDEYFYDSGNAPWFAAGDFTVWGSRIGWVSSDGKYEIAGFVRNLTEEEYVSDGFELFGGLGIVPGAPRTAGVYFNYKI